MARCRNLLNNAGEFAQSEFFLKAATASLKTKSGGEEGKEGSADYRDHCEL